MTKIIKNKLFTFLYLLCLYLACQFIPYSKMTSSYPFQVLIKSIFLGVVLFLAIYEMIKDKSFIKKKNKWQYYLLSFPLLFACFSNFFYALIFHVEKNQVQNWMNFTLSTILLILSVAIEEILFRMLLIDLFDQVFQKKKQGWIITILLSSLSFSLMHIINFTSGNYFGTLLQIGYTFVLGFILGYLAERVDNILLPLLGHFTFNFFNMNLYTTIYNQFDYPFSYTLFSLGFVFYSLLYLVLMYFIMKRSEQHAS